MYDYIARSIVSRCEGRDGRNVHSRKSVRTISRISVICVASKSLAKTCINISSCKAIFFLNRILTGSIQSSIKSRESNFNKFKHEDSILSLLDFDNTKLSLIQTVRKENLDYKYFPKKCLSPFLKFVITFWLVSYRYPIKCCRKGIEKHILNMKRKLEDS